MEADARQVVLTRAERDKKTFEKDFSDISSNVTQFYNATSDGGRISKAVYGDYSNHDVSADGLNLDAIDKIQDKYKEYKENIEKTYYGEDKDDSLKALDEAYDAVFKKNVIDPVSSIIKNKKNLFQVDSEESVKSMTGGGYYIDFSEIKNPLEALGLAGK